MRKTTRRIVTVLLSLVMVMSLAGPVFADNQPNMDGQYYSSYKNLDEVRDASLEINLQIAQEGTVLMKNAGDTLPLQDVKYVSVFGKAAEDPFYAGGGSGTADGYYPDEMYTTIYKSLEDAGYSVNPALRSFYESAAAGEGLEGSSFSYSISGINMGSTGSTSSMGGETTEETPPAEGEGSEGGEGEGSEGGEAAAPVVTWSGNRAQISDVNPSDFTGAVLDSYNRYSDAAIIVLGRTGSEGGDRDMGRSKAAFLSEAENKMRYNGNSEEQITAALAALEEKLDTDPEFAADALNHGLTLTYEEQELIKHVTANFDKVIVVLNVPEQIEMGWAEDGSLGEIDAVLWVGHPGLNGFEALGQVLNGQINPSGRLVDIWARDMTKDPTYPNLIENLQSENGTADYVYTDETGSYTFHSIEYEEGIYYGYRYYETAAVEGFINYDEAVVYPFGHGLSYTSFKQTMDKVEKKTDADGNVYYDITVTVTNTGDAAGKEVVQLYYTAPYTDGGIEKAHVVLGAFDKTDLLQPGAKQTMVLTVYEQDMASYDYNDANGNGHTGYELDAGTYTFKIMGNSHDVIAQKSVSIGAINYDTDRYTGAEVNNLFSSTEDITYNSLYIAYDENGNALYDGKGGLNHDMVVMSRADFAGTFPTAPVVTLGENGSVGTEGTVVFDMSKEVYDDITGITFTPGSTEDEADEVWYDYYMDWYNAENGEGQTWTQGVIGETVLNLDDMTGKSWDDPAWVTFLNQMSWEQLSRFLNYSGYWSTSLSDELSRRKGTSLESNGVELVDGQTLGVPFTEQADGPVALKRQNTGSGGLEDVGIQWTATMNIASTWNVELAEIRGVMIGEEALALELDGWYGVAMNIHRSPWGGRNFEYFSEDPLLSGKISAAQVVGCQSKGVNAFIKHFAVNHQDTDRGGALPGMTMAGSSDQGLITMVDEQTIRECYTKSFQIAVQEGGANGLMNSMNNIGVRSNSNNFNLMTALLREEWGFEGYTVTDIVPASAGNPYADPETLPRIGADLPLNANSGIPISGDWDAANNCVVITTADGTTVRNDVAWATARMSVKRAMYVNANSSAMRNDLDLTAFGANTEITATIGVSTNASVAADAAALGTGDVVYSLDGALPAGVTFDPFSGSFSGTPIEAGTFTVNVTMAADGGWIKNTKTFTLEVVNDLFEVPMISGKVGQSVSAKVSSSILEDEGAAVRFEATGLPAGVTLSEDGTVSGTPTEAGSYQVTIKAYAETEVQGSSGGTSIEVQEYILHTYCEISNSDVVAPTEPQPTDPQPTAPQPTDPQPTAPVSDPEPAQNDPTSMVVGIIALIIAAAALVMNFMKKKETK